MKNVKAKNEQLNSTKSSMKNMLNKCMEETRGFTKEEENKYNELKIQKRKLERELGIFKPKQTNKFSDYKVSEERALIDKFIKNGEGADEDGVLELKGFEAREYNGMPVNREIRSGNHFQNTIGHVHIGSSEYPVYGNAISSNVTFANQSAIIPKHLSPEIVKRVEEVAPLWSMIDKYIVPDQGKLDVLIEKEPNGKTPGAFVGEEERVTSSKFEFDTIQLKEKRCGAFLQLTQQAINDCGIDIVEYTKKHLFHSLGRALEKSLILGQNPNCANAEEMSKGFQGISNAPEECEIIAKSDNVQYEDYRRMLFSIHPQYQNDDLVWVMGRNEFNRLMKIKDCEGRPLFIDKGDIINNKPTYLMNGFRILISDFVEEYIDKLGNINRTKDVAYLVNLRELYACMVTQEIEFSRISDNDTESALDGTVAFMIDMYADAKFKNLDALRVLRLNKAETLEEVEVASEVETLEEQPKARKTKK